MIAVVIPELVERPWYHHLLHNQRPAVIKAMFFLRGTKRMMIINVPWYVDKADQEEVAATAERGQTTRGPRHPGMLATSAD